MPLACSSRYVLIFIKKINKLINTLKLITCGSLPISTNILYVPKGSESSVAKAIYTT